MFRIVSTALVILFAFAGSNASASSSPVYNGRIAFFTSTGIASMNPDGSGQWGVELQVGDTQPAWSPDGTKLAVVTHWAGRNGIELLQPNGNALGMLTNDAADALPAWSPDGKTVAYVSNTNNIWLVNADGSSPRPLTSDNQGNVSRPTWSPDGTTIAFSAYRQAADFTSSQIVYSVNVATGKEKALSTGWDSNPSWSPDGKTILFQTARGGAQGIFAMNADGSSVHAVLTIQTYTDSPTWSPDGTQIAFTGNGQIWVMNADGSNAHQLTTGDGTYNAYPAWQPLGPPPLGSGCTLWGTSANDLLVGTGGSDVICGLDGNDTIIGLGGNDTMNGGAGDDYLAGGTGHDLIYGADGNDTIDARNGSSDVVSGGAGTDTAIVSNARVASGLYGTFMTSIERPHVDNDLAAWMPTSSDTSAPTNPSQLAFDGLIQDWWNSGGYAPHWVEVDLQYPRTIGHVQLVAPQLGSNATVLLLGRSSDDQPFRLLHTFRGPFADQQALTLAPKYPWRNVRYLRLQVGSADAWVSWREIEVYSPVAAKKKR